MRISVINMALCTGRHLPSRLKKRKYNPVCVEDEGSINDTLNEELSTDSDDKMNLENEGQSASEESSNASLESKCEGKTCVVRIDGQEEVTMGDKKPKAYTFTKIAGPRFNLLPDADPMDYFSLFFND
jgi:hypothetical protein